MENSKNGAKKIFGFQDAAQLKSTYGVLLAAHFQCYACVDVLPLSAFGQFYGFRIATEPHQYPVCADCHRRLKKENKDTVTEALIQMCEQNVVRELQAAKYPNDPHFPLLNIWKLIRAAQEWYGW